MTATSRAFGSIRLWVLAFAGVILLLFAYYVAADRITPYTGNAYLQAFVVQVAPQVENPVVEVLVENGSQVKAGDALYRLDDRRYKQEVARLNATLVEAQATFEELKSQLDALKATVKERQANVTLAEKTYKRTAALVKQQATAQQRLDDATDKLHADTALLNNAKAEEARLEQQLGAVIDGEPAIVREVKAKLAEAQLMLSFTTVVAPVDGIVDNLQLRAGTYVKVGQPVMTLVDTTRWWVVANYQENALSVIQPGQPADLSFIMYPGEVFSGKVQSIGWGVGEGQGLASGELPVVENPKAWLNLSQRFQVRLTPDDLPPNALGTARPFRVGASVRAVIFTEQDSLFNPVARWLIRTASYLDYIY